MIKVTTRRGKVRGHIHGLSDDLLFEYECITNQLIRDGFTKEEIIRSAARGIVAGQEEVEGNDNV